MGFNWEFVSAFAVVAAFLVFAYASRWAVRRRRAGKLLLPSDWRWQHFYWAWLRKILPSRPFSWIDALAGLLGFVIPGGFAAYRGFGHEVPQDWGQLVNALAWQIPLALLALATVFRIVVAPYWIYRDVAGDRKQRAIPHNRDDLVGAVFDLERTANEYLRVRDFTRHFQAPGYSGSPYHSPEVRQAWRGFEEAYRSFEKALVIAGRYKFARLHLVLMYLHNEVLRVEIEDEDDKLNDAISNARAVVGSEIASALAWLEEGVPVLKQSSPGTGQE